MFVQRKEISVPEGRSVRTGWSECREEREKKEGKRTDDVGK